MLVTNPRNATLQGVTPLHIAVQIGSLAVAANLLQWGAPLTFDTTTGCKVRIPCFETWLSTCSCQSKLANVPAFNKAACQNPVIETYVCED